jgi:hypothetical protein
MRWANPSDFANLESFLGYWDTTFDNTIKHPTQQQQQQQNQLCSTWAFLRGKQFGSQSYDFWIHDYLGTYNAGDVVGESVFRSNIY